MIKIAGGIVLAFVAIYVIPVAFYLALAFWAKWYEKRQLAKMNPRERAAYFCHKISEELRNR